MRVSESLPVQAIHLREFYHLFKCFCCELIFVKCIEYSIIHLMHSLSLFFSFVMHQSF